MNFFWTLLNSVMPPRARVWIKMRLAAFRGDLPMLATLSGTDKWGAHWYVEHYGRHFAPLRRKRLKVFEIGVGGGDNPRRGGASLRMWKQFFPRAQIYSIDIYDKQSIAESRITIFKGDQSDPAFLRQVVRTMGGVDLIIDDGSHRNAHVLKSFEILFPLLSERGIYCVEDLQTSYWPEFGGTSHDFNTQKTTVGFFKTLADGLNYEEIIREGYKPTYYDEHIVGLHFYHNMVIVEKGRNKEGSNILTARSI